MSDQLNTNISVLLPDAKIEIFALSEETRAIASNLADDWRFGRVNVKVFDGSTDEAIELYREKPSPDLLIVETDKIDDSFPDKIQTLGQCCVEGTNAVIIGPDNDIQLYRRLKDVGVSDYYVHPVSIEVLKDDIARLIINALGVSGSRIFACIGAKGGVGTTLAAQALAYGISAHGSQGETGQPCLLMDCAGGRSYLSIALAKNEPTGTLAEALRATESDDIERLERMIVPIGDNLHILSTGGEEILSSSPDPKSFEKLLNVLAKRFANIVIDLDGADSALGKNILKQCNEIVLVTDPGLVSLRAARTLRQEILSLRGDEKAGIHYLVNRMGQFSSYELGKKDLVEAMGSEPIGGIAYNPKFFGALDFGEKTLLDEEPGQKLIQVLMKVSGANTSNSSGDNKNLTKSRNKSSKKATGIGGFLNKFTS